MLSGTASFLHPASAMEDPYVKQKSEAVRIAHDQESVIKEKLRRMGLEMPKFSFLEIIGKGAYGRVFKCHDQAHNRVVAVKIIDVDATDYKVNVREKDESIEVTLHEIRVLQELRDSKAKNVNQFFDAFQMHSQLWIVTEYCPGGSLHTLMRATGNRLDEKYIIPVARELAIAMDAVHDAGIIHRDLKAANVMIHENGSLQVIDFGVAGVLESKKDKRTTVIGTPHWMPPEMHKRAPPEGLKYGTEIDVWAYGCTIYEITTGLPPNARTQAGRMLAANLSRSPPRLSPLDFPEGLCDFVAFVLEPKASERPSMHEVLQHNYINNTEISNPTTSLADLVRTYYRWEHSGGQRSSLFIAAGAPAAAYPEDPPPDDDWNFSTTASFDKQFEIMDTEQLDTLLQAEATAQHEQSQKGPFDEGLQSSPPRTDEGDEMYQSEPLIYTPASPSDAATPTVESTQAKLALKGKKPMTQEDIDRENQIKRGEQALQGLFEKERAPYKYEIKDESLGGIQQSLAGRPETDLPLRPSTDAGPVSHNEVEANIIQGDHIPNIDLAHVGTIKANRMQRFNKDGDSDQKYTDTQPEGGNAKRKTTDWTFSTALPIEESEAEDSKRATRDWTFGNAGYNDHYDLNDNLDDNPVIYAQDTYLARPAPPVGNTSKSHLSMDVFDFGALEHDDYYARALPQVPQGPQGLASSAQGEFDDGDMDLSTVKHDLQQDNSRSRQPLGELDEGISATISHPDSLLPPLGGPSSQPTANPSHFAKLASAESSDGDLGSEDDLDPEDNPFDFTDTATKDEITKQINDHLDQKGVTDVFERAKKRRHMLIARKEMKKYMKKDLKEAGYTNFKKKHIIKAQGPLSKPLSEQDPELAAIWKKFDPRTNPAPPTRPYVYGRPQPSERTVYPMPADGMRSTVGPDYVYDAAIDDGSHLDEHGRPYWLPPAPGTRRAPTINSDKRISPFDLSSFGDHLHTEARNLLAETTNDARNSDQELYTNLTTVMEQARNRLDPDQIAQLERMSVDLATRIVTPEEMGGPSPANRSATGSSRRTNRRPFPDIRPPSAAALQPDNPAALEAELRRELTDFVEALEVLGEELDEEIANSPSSSDDEGDHESGSGELHEGQEVGSGHEQGDGNDVGSDG